MACGMSYEMVDSLPVCPGGREVTGLGVQLGGLISPGDSRLCVPPACGSLKCIGSVF